MYRPYLAFNISFDTTEARKLFSSDETDPSETSAARLNINADTYPPCCISLPLIFEIKFLRCTILHREHKDKPHNRKVN